MSNWNTPQASYKKGLTRIPTKVEKKSLLTRADFMANLEIPTSTAHRIIIPSNSSGNSFKNGCYVNEYLDKIMSEDEFNEVVQHLSKIAHKCYSIKRSMDNQEVPNWIVSLYTLSYALIIVFMAMFYYGTVNKNDTLKYISYGVLATSFVNLMVLLIKYGIASQNNFQSFEELVKVRVDDYFAVINKHFVERGLWWRVVPGHYWIELRIDQTLKNDIDRLQQAQNEGSFFFTKEEEMQTPMFAAQYLNALTENNAGDKSTKTRRNSKGFNQVIIYQNHKDKPRQTPVVASNYMKNLKPDKPNSNQQSSRQPSDQRFQLDTIEATLEASNNHRQGNIVLSTENSSGRKKEKNLGDQSQNLRNMNTETGFELGGFTLIQQDNKGHENSGLMLHRMEDSQDQDQELLQHINVEDNELDQMLDAYLKPKDGQNAYSLKEGLVVKNTINNEYNEEIQRHSSTAQQYRGDNSLLENADEDKQTEKHLLVRKHESWKNI